MKVAINTEICKRCKYAKKHGEFVNQCELNLIECDCKYHHGLNYCTIPKKCPYYNVHIATSTEKTKCKSCLKLLENVKIKAKGIV